MVHERAHELELINEIRAFWAGERIKVGTVKDGLRQIGQIAELSLQSAESEGSSSAKIAFYNGTDKGGGIQGLGRLNR